MTEPGRQPEDVQAFMEGLEFGETATEAPPRPEGEVMAVRSVRWPADLDRRVKAAAAARDTSVSALIREWAELELAELEGDQLISRADALRALAGLHPPNAA